MRAVSQRLRDAAGRRDIPAADEQRSHRRDVRRETRRDTSLYPAQVSFGGSLVLLAREQQRHVDRYARVDRLLDEASPRAFPEILMLQRLARPARACKSCAWASVARHVVREQRRDFEDTQPSTPQVRSWIGRNKSGGPREIFQRSSKKSASADRSSTSPSRIAAS